MQSNWYDTRMEENIQKMEKEEGRINKKDKFAAVVKKFAPGLTFLKPGESVDKRSPTGAKNKRVKLVGMINGKQALAVLNNMNEIVGAATVKDALKPRLEKYDKNK
jgi:hypothetical protein